MATLRGTTSVLYPPTIPICPDYYIQVKGASPETTVYCKAIDTFKDKLETTSSTAGAVQIDGTGKYYYGYGGKACSAPEFNLSTYYTGTSANCEKKKWVNGCNNIPSWEGVSYSVINPCAT